MMKLYLIALVAAILILTPSNVSSADDFRYECHPTFVRVFVNPQPMQSGSISINGVHDPACTKEYGPGQKVSYDMSFAKCAGGSKHMALMYSSVTSITMGSSTSTSSSSTTKTISC
ncbi:uncharacterized protein LOC103574358 [Microplitis demolitor]|uniref:uncharacterized protein LOC103574358 n=1 Tax=Microplitis demolitor TaxID=69319 RepID=UPI0004400387|nr:uncharacterized protein LOC103574358 [Microplitis demolitor]